jgi:hypothetical protein
MIKVTYLLLITLISGLFAKHLLAKTGNDPNPMTYDKGIFIISNYSGAEAVTPEEN